MSPTGGAADIIDLAARSDQQRRLHRALIMRAVLYRGSGEVYRHIGVHADIPLHLFRRAVAVSFVDPLHPTMTPIPGRQEPVDQQLTVGEFFSTADTVDTVCLGLWTVAIEPFFDVTAEELGPVISCVGAEGMIGGGQPNITRINHRIASLTNTYVLAQQATIHRL